MDGKKVKEMLQGRVEDVCRRYLSNGWRKGHQWTCGNIHNAAPSSKQKGGSLLVELEPGRKFDVGFWHDFETGESGDIIELWKQAEGIDFREAMTHIRAFLGVKDEQWQRYDGKHSGKSRLKAGPATQKLVCNPVKKGSPVWKWLTEERHITPLAIEAYRVGEYHGLDRNKKEHDFVIFPFYDWEGNLVRLKFRAIDDKGLMWQQPSKLKAPEYEHGYQKLLWGYQALTEGSSLCITEGELDAMTLFDAGEQALSLPEGAQATASDENISESHREWLEHDTDYLEPYTDIVLAFDGDEPGRKTTVALLPRFGRHRCRVVEWPEGTKDANEAFTAGHDLVPLIKNAVSQDPDDLKHPGDICEEIYLEFYPEKNGVKGIPLPYKMPFEFTPGQLNIWHGYNGHGKTVNLTYTLVHMAKECGESSCIASLEWKASKTFRNMVRQSLAKSKPTRAEVEAVVGWMDKYFMVYDHVGEASAEEILDVFDYSNRKYGIQHFVVDSLMMIKGINGDDWEAQKELCKKLKAFAVDRDAHCHLVAHSKKPDSRHPEDKTWPPKYAISGSGNISNIADNIICVWRNIAKENNMNMALDLGSMGSVAEADALAAEWRDREDAMLIIQKQRESGAQPMKRLWFDAGKEGSWQYSEEMRAAFKPMLEFSEATLI